MDKKLATSFDKHAPFSTEKQSTELLQLRGLAALLVFFYHSTHSARNAGGAEGWPIANNPISAILWEGHSAVALFLVLSGFLLATLAFDRQDTYLQFIERRVRRIFPLMLIVLVFGLYTVKDIDFGQILAAFLMLRNTTASFNDPAGLTGTLWTVAVEFQFYLVAPIIFALTMRGKFARFILPAIALMWLLRMIVLLPLHDNGGELYRISYFTIVGRANQFLVGVGLAYLVFVRPPTRGRHWRIALAVSALLVALFLWAVNFGGGIGTYRAWHVFLPEIEAIVWAFFLLSFWMSNPVRWKPAAEFLKFMGTISFGVYVIHFAVQREFWTLVYPKFLGAPSLNLAAATAVNIGLLAFVSAVAALSWYYIEKPIKGWRREAVTAPPDAAMARHTSQ